MNSFIKYLIGKALFIIGIPIAVIITSFFIFITMLVEIWKPNYEMIETKSEKVNDSLYIKRKTWGITGDHVIVVISNNNNLEFEPESSKDYIYPGCYLLFYRLDGDTLSMYVYSKSDIPSDFDSKIAVKQIELPNPEMMDLMENYKAEGLKRFMSGREP